MTTFLSDIIMTVFRPSVAALSIALAAAIVTVDSNPNKISIHRVDATNLSCTGLFRPICQAFGS